MAKLYFRYGAMTSAKTMNLLSVAHTYELQGKKVLLVKPCLDTRFGGELIRSRSGIERQADLLAKADTVIGPAHLEGMSCVLVDEAQFIYPSVIEQLRDIASFQDIPVICYGLRADFRGSLFDGAKRLFELADCIEEVKTTCFFCNHRAIMNLKHVDGVATLSGPSIVLGAEELYVPACYKCYKLKLREAGAA